jgi:hypothetical protein
MFMICSIFLNEPVQGEGAMVYTFDSLGYAKRLRESGVPQNQAEAHAEAARDFIMAELATRADLLAVRADLLATEQRLQSAIESTREELLTRIDTQSLRVTVRLGAMLAVGIGALAAILKLA